MTLLVTSIKVSSELEALQCDPIAGPPPPLPTFQGPASWPHPTRRAEMAALSCRASSPLLVSLIRSGAAAGSLDWREKTLGILGVVRNESASQFKTAAD